MKVTKNQTTLQHYETLWIKIILKFNLFSCYLKSRKKRYLSSAGSLPKACSSQSSHRPKQISSGLLCGWQDTQAINPSLSGHTLQENWVRNAVAQSYTRHSDMGFGHPKWWLNHYSLPCPPSLLFLPFLSLFVSPCSFLPCFKVGGKKLHRVYSEAGNLACSVSHSTLIAFL